MDMQDKLVVLIPIMMIVIYVMGLFIWKYYDSFEFRDKMIIGYLGIVPMVALFIYFCYDYPSSNSFFIALFPFLIIRGVYKLIRQYQLKGNQFLFKDNIIFKSLEILGYTAMAIYFSFTYKDGFGVLMIAIPLVGIGYGINSVIKLYHAEPKTES